MPYCVHEDVGAKSGYEYSDTSQPTREQVESTITRIGHEIDGVLRAAGYTLPVTDADDLELLKHYCTLGSAYHAWHDGSFNDDAPARVEAWERDYRDFLARMRRGEQKLAGQDWPDEQKSLSVVDIVSADGFAEAASGSEYT